MRNAVLGLAFAAILVIPARAAEPAGLELVVQTGHTGAIHCVAWSADGRWVLTGADDTAAILWDAQTGEKLRTFSGPTSAVQGIALSADGNRALTGYKQGNAILWDVRTGNKLRTFARHEDELTSVALSADGSRALTGSKDKTAILWDAKTGARLRTFTGHTNPILSVALNSDGSRALTGAEDRTAVLWDAESGKKLHTLTGHTRAVTGVALSKDGGRALTGSADRTAVLWDSQTGEKLRTFSRAFNSVSAVALSGDGKRVLTGHDSLYEASVWDVQSGEQLLTFPAHKSSIPGLALNSDGSLALTGSWDGAAVIWDAETGKQIRDFSGRASPVTHAAVSPDNNRILTLAGDNAILWDTTMEEMPRVLGGAAHHVQTAGISGDGKCVMTSSSDALTLWDAGSGEKLRSFPFKEGVEQVKTMALSRDGHRVLTGDYDKKAVLWDTQTGQKLQTFTGDGVAFSVSLSDDGGRALIGFSLENAACLWDANTGKKLFTLAGHSWMVPCAVLSGDGSRALTGSWDRTAILWDAQSGKRLRAYGWHWNFILCVALSSDFSRVLTGSMDKTAALWDAKTGDKLHTFTGHTHVLRAVTLSGDGKYALTAALDGTTRIWDTKTGKELCALLTLNGGKDWLAVTPEGLFDGSPDATRLISYRIADTLEMVPLERYQQKYWQPGLLAMIMRGERPVPKVDIIRSVPPAVRFAGDLKPGMELKSSKLTVEAVGESRSGHPIKAFRLLVDGRPYRGQRGVFRVPEPKLGEQTARWEIELDPGRHTLKVLADTEYVQGASEPIEVSYVGGEPAVELPALYVLAIGVSKHSVPSRALDYADRDAVELARALEKYSRPLYRDIDTKVIVNEEATRRGIFNGLQWLRERMSGRPNAVGVVFFAGHGEKDPADGALYFLPYDSEEKDFAGTAIDAETLKRQLASIPRRLVLMLDACHSGQIGAEKTRGTGLTDQLLRDLTAEENGLTVLCSALGHQKAQESRAHQHGMFTQAVLEALSGQGNGQSGDEGIKPTTIDGSIYLSTLTAYVSVRVRQLSRGEQSLVHGTPRFVRDYPLSKP